MPAPRKHTRVVSPLAAMLIFSLAGPSASAQGSAPAHAAPQQLSLAQALTRALGNNLELRAVRADTGLALAQLVGSRLRPNPSLAAEYLSNGDARVSLTQDLQLWGVRGFRIREAEFERDRARYAALDAARLMRREVIASYRELLFLREQTDLLDSLVTLSARIARTAQLAVQQGLGSELDSRLSLTAAQRAVLDRDARRREADIAQVQLARLLHDSLTTSYQLTDSLPVVRLPFLSVPTERPAPGQVRYEPDRVGVDSLLRIAMTRRPDAQAAQASIEAQAAALAAAQRAGKPSLAIGAVYGRTLDEVRSGPSPTSVTDNAFGLGFVLGLPVRNRNQGEILRATSAGVAAELRLAGIRQGIERDVRVAANRVGLTASNAETLRLTIVPANQSALRLAELAFARGQVGIFEVLQVQRSYVEGVTALLEARRQFAAALAELEAAIGTPIP